MKNHKVNWLFFLNNKGFADNVNITPGTGGSGGSGVIAADEVSDGTLGVCKAQYIKVMDGTLNGTDKLIISSAGAAKVDGSAVTQPVSLTTLPAMSGPSSIGANRKVVTTAGTAVTLAFAACKFVIITAETDNTGIISVGDSGTIATEGSQVGFILYAGQSSGRIDISNTSLIYINSTVSGDGVTYAYFN